MNLSKHVVHKKLSNSTPCEMRTPSGRTYLWTYTSDRKKRFECSTISIKANIPFHFSLRSEGPLHRFAKTFGMATEYQTNDPSFDQRVYIECDSQEFGNKIRGNSTLKNTIVQLLSLGENIKGDSKNGLLTIDLLKASPQLDDEQAEEIVSLMHNITSQVLAFNYQSIRKPIVRQKLSTALIVCYISVLVIAIVTLVSAPYRLAFLEVGYIFHAIGYALVSSFVLLIALRILFASSSYGVIALISYLCLGIPATFLASLSVLYHINYLYDESNTETYYAKITEKYITYHGKQNRKDYNIRMASWRSGQSLRSFSVDYNVYQQINPYDSIVIFKVHPGYLGYEWIEDYQIIYD